MVIRDKALNFTEIFSVHENREPVGWMQFRVSTVNPASDMIFSEVTYNKLRRHRGLPIDTDKRSCRAGRQDDQIPVSLLPKIRLGDRFKQRDLHWPGISCAPRALPESPARAYSDDSGLAN
jgi:hypothetical protein